jgi:hypothetical protein
MPWPGVADVVRPMDQLVTVAPTAPVSEALKTRADVNRLPVVADGRLAGIVSRAHILQLLESRTDFRAAYAPFRTCSHIWPRSRLMHGSVRAESGRPRSEGPDGSAIVRLQLCETALPPASSTRPTPVREANVTPGRPGASASTSMATQAAVTS